MTTNCSSGSRKAMVKVSAELFPLETLTEPLLCLQPLVLQVTWCLWSLSGIPPIPSSNLTTSRGLLLPLCLLFCPIGSLPRIQAHLETSG